LSLVSEEKLETSLEEKRKNAVLCQG
jgi:hypothetical protein